MNCKIRPQIKPRQNAIILIFWLAFSKYCSIFLDHLAQDFFSFYSQKALLWSLVGRWRCKSYTEKSRSWGLKLTCQFFELYATGHLPCCSGFFICNLNQTFLVNYFFRSFLFFVISNLLRARSFWTRSFWGFFGLKASKVRSVLSLKILSCSK